MSFSVKPGLVQHRAVDLNADTATKLWLYALLYDCKGNSVLRVSAAGGFSAIRTVRGLSGQIRHTSMQAHTPSEEVPLFLQSFPAGMIHSKYTQSFH